jgi:hypothetical protein
MASLNREAIDLKRVAYFPKFNFFCQLLLFQPTISRLNMAFRFSASKVAEIKIEIFKNTTKLSSVVEVQLFPGDTCRHFDIVDV